MGLLDAASLQTATYDEQRSGQNAGQSAPGQAVVSGQSAPGQGEATTTSPNADAASNDAESAKRKTTRPRKPELAGAS
jgi:hypothetical protein